MTESPEHSQLMQQARQLKQAQRLAQGSLKHLSQGYWQLDQVQKSLDGDAQQAQDQLAKTLKKVMNNIARAYWSINKI
jgi:ribosomal protein L37AE/L43A